MKSPDRSIRITPLGEGWFLATIHNSTKNIYYREYDFRPPENMVAHHYEVDPQQFTAFPRAVISYCKKEADMLGYRDHYANLNGVYFLDPTHKHETAKDRAYKDYMNARHEVEKLGSNRYRKFYRQVDLYRLSHKEELLEKRQQVVADGIARSQLAKLSREEYAEVVRIMQQHKSTIKDAYHIWRMENRK